MASLLLKPIKFLREVKVEFKKVTWPSFKDTRMMTLMVFVLVTFIGIYLWLVDAVLSSAVKAVIDF